MPVIKYSNELKISNVESLPRGLGARYLLVIAGLNCGEYIAKQWLRKLPAKVGPIETIIDLKQ